MKRKNDLAIDENTSKQVSFGERIHHDTNNDESETTIKEETTRSISISPTFNRSSISNSSLSLSSRALSTMFYSQCALSGISSEDADNAILESRSWYHKWWRQQRFQNDDDNNDSTDNNDRKSSSSWPKKNRRLNNNNKSIDNSYNNSTGTTEDNNLPEEHHLIPDDDVESLKRQVLKSLHNSGGDVTDVEFLKYLSMLSELYSYMAADKNNLDHLTEEKKDEEEGLLSSEFGAGVWVTLNKPNFQECLGRNPDTGEYMYTLGRMSFDMFRKDLKCSVKGIYNIIEDVPQEDLNIEHFLLPNGLTKEDCIDQGIMTYNISVAFTIENTNLKAVMTNYGYLLPDPYIPNRFSIWFTRGILEQDPDDNTDDNNNNNIPTDEWKETFSNSMNNRSMTERAKLFAAKLMLGIKAPGKMEEDGSMEYNLYKPIRVYCDVIYMDDKLRIIKGHHGTIYVLYRISS